MVLARIQSFPTRYLSHGQAFVYQFVEQLSRNVNALRWALG
ncbi:hypothetical protein [Pseudomonas sp. FG-3G]|nr:hypothetical protein [Pseudomonas sp. FG-3G]